MSHPLAVYPLPSRNSTIPLLTAYILLVPSRVFEIKSPCEAPHLVHSGLYSGQWERGLLPAQRLAGRAKEGVSRGLQDCLESCFLRKSPDRSPAQNDKSRIWGRGRGRSLLRAIVFEKFPGGCYITVVSRLKITSLQGFLNESGGKV